MVIFMGLILKIPVAAMLYIVWWAVRQNPEVDEVEPPNEGDGQDFHRFGRAPRRPPRTPRRGGPHAAPRCAPEPSARRSVH